MIMLKFWEAHSGNFRSAFSKNEPYICRKRGTKANKIHSEHYLGTIVPTL